MSKRIKTIILTLITVAAIVLLVVFFPEILSLLGGILGLFLPFILGYIYSILVAPLTKLLQKRFRLPQSASAIIVILFTLGIVGGIVAGVVFKITDEIKSIYENLPAITAGIMLRYREISEKFSVFYEAAPLAMQEAIDGVGENIMKMLQGIASLDYTPIISTAGNAAKRVPGMFIAVIAFLLSSYFMVSDSNNINEKLHSIMSPTFKSRIDTVKGEIKKYVGGYVKAQLIIMMFSFTILFIGFNILKVDYSLIIAMATAIFDALPLFGSGAVLWTWAAVCFLTSDFMRGIGLIIIYLCVIFTRQMIEPKIVSSKIGLHPILTLMSMYIGYRIFSIGGMIFGPLTLMLVISLYRAGFFNSIIGFFRFLAGLIKKEFSDLKSQD